MAAVICIFLHSVAIRDCHYLAPPKPETSSCIALGKMRERYQFLLVGYVVMPNHVHLLISESSKATPSDVLKVLKQRVSRDLRRESEENKNPHVRTTCGAPHHPSTNQSEDLERFWQPRFYDFNVWSKEKVREKLEYMHANPITRNLVDHPKDWPWSSWLFYAKGEVGLVPIDPVGW